MSNEDSSSEPKAEGEPQDAGEPRVPVEPGEAGASAEPGEAGASAEPAEAAPAAGTGGATPRKKRKKKKKDEGAVSAEPAVFERAALDARGRERPRFLLRFPEDAELEPLIAAFEAGNYAHVREAAPALAERAERAEVRRAAEELLRRIEPDPLLRAFLAISVALLVAVAAHAYLSH